MKTIRRLTRRGKFIACAAVLASSFSVASLAAQEGEQLPNFPDGLKVGVIVDHPPFGMIDRDGEPAGYDVAVSKLLKEFLHTKLQIVQLAAPSRIPYLKSNKVDLVIATMAPTEERKKQVNFSEPYSALQLVVYGDADTQVSSSDDLGDHRIGVVRGSPEAARVKATAPSNTNIRRFNDDSSTIQALLSGQVEFIAVGKLVVPEIEKVSSDSGNEIKYVLHQQVHGIVVKKGEDKLLKAVNAFLENAKKNGDLNAAYEKWLGQPLPDLNAIAKGS